MHMFCVIIIIIFSFNCRFYHVWHQTCNDYLYFCLSSTKPASADLSVQVFIMLDLVFFLVNLNSSTKLALLFPLTCLNNCGFLCPLFSSFFKSPLAFFQFLWIPLYLMQTGHQKFWIPLHLHLRSLGTSKLDLLDATVFLSFHHK